MISIKTNEANYKKPTLYVYKFKHKVACEWADQEAVDKLLADGRYFSPWLPLILPHFIPCVPHQNTNFRGSDAVNNSKRLLEFRCLTKSGVKFQLSSCVGKDRHCSDEDFIESITNKDFVIVDIRQSPNMLACCIKESVVRSRMESGSLTKSGIKGNRFWALVQ